MTLLKQFLQALSISDDESDKVKLEIRDQNFIFKFPQEAPTIGVQKVSDEILEPYVKDEKTKSIGVNAVSYGTSKLFLKEDLVSSFTKQFPTDSTYRMVKGNEDWVIVSYEKMDNLIKKLGLDFTTKEFADNPDAEVTLNVDNSSASASEVSKEPTTRSSSQQDTKTNEVDEFKQFKSAYRKAYDEKFFTNPLSYMKYQLDKSEGKTSLATIFGGVFFGKPTIADMQGVRGYAKDHEDTRTAAVLKTLTK